MNKNLIFGISVPLIAFLIMGILVLSLGAKKVVESNEYVSKPEILLNESEIEIIGLNDPIPSTDGLTLIGSDSESTQNAKGSLISSYRMYSMDNEKDPDYNYYIVWVQANGKGNKDNPLNNVWTGITNLTDGQIVDWSPAGTLYTTNGDETTVILKGETSASISQTFIEPSGKLQPNKFTTIQFEPLFDASSLWGTSDSAFSVGGTLIKSPDGKTPTFNWYAGLN